VTTAVERAGAGDVVARLPRGLDTQLGPTWHQGSASFGQWQKLALARGFMRDDPLLVVLDEPTAALDAETEHALFERFAAASHAANDDGRITVLVSHRFSTVRMADLIVVLDGARVAEAGSHQELMQRNGLYAELTVSRPRRTSRVGAAHRRATRGSIDHAVGSGGFRFRMCRGPRGPARGSRDTRAQGPRLHSEAAIQVANLALKSARVQRSRSAGE
jgi:ABC-type multidrug transport system ATPase subunit